MSDDNVTRVSVVRTAIQQQYCHCQGIRSLGVNGTTRFLIADGVSADTLDKFFIESKVHCPVFISESVEECWDKLVILSNRGIPIILETSKPLENRVLSLLSNLPHSSIQVSMDFLREFPFDSLRDSFSRFQSFREMMALAKAWKISVGLHLGYQPVLVNRHHLYELIQSVRPTVSNMTVHFPGVTPLQREDTIWNKLIQEYGELICHAYNIDVSTGLLEVRESYKKELLKELDFFLKSRKISLNEMDIHSTTDMRIRHKPLSEDLNPFGVRMIPYVEEGSDTICKCCGKLII